VTAIHHAGLVEPGASAPPDVHQGVRELLAEVDREFVPALSARADTLLLPSGRGPGGGLGRGPGAGPSEPSLDRYLQAMESEAWLGARDDDVVGLLSFLARHEDPHLASWSPSLYVTTLAVRRHARHTGIGAALYDALEQVARERGVRYLATRTWSTNVAHLRILRARGFADADRVDGGRGAGIDTLYLACDLVARRPGAVRTSLRDRAP